MNANNLKAVKAYFKGNVRFGRTTKLVNTITGEVVIECLGVCTKRDLIAARELQVKLGR